MSSNGQSPPPPVLGAAGLDGSGDTQTPPEQKTEDEWISRARLSWMQSTSWFDASVRTQLRKNISNFRSIHPEGSKYLHPSFRARSRTFRPKTRALGRRIEASLAVAMFATSDLVNVSAWNASDPMAQARAKLKQKVMQYRLEADETTWFLTCLGAAQDAYVSGIVISHQYWKYKSVTDKRYNIYKNEFADGTNTYDVKEDHNEIITANRPVCDLIPVERFRFDPACDWRDPATTSPYLIYECPTYMGDVMEQVEDGVADAIPAEGFDNTYWWAIASDDYDSLRAAREGSRVDKYADQKAIPDTQTVVLRKHVHRIKGRDWYFETLQDMVMFRSPQLLTDVYPHLKEGQRPFVTGLLVPEVHKVYPSSGVQLIENLQEEINDVSNLRQDTVKMSTFGRWEVRRSSTVDVATLKAGVPSSVIAVDKVGQDVAELKQREVPQSAFMETDRLQIDLDDVSGGMSQATANSNKALNQDQTLGGMNLLEGQAGQIRELEIRTLVKTWAEPVMQHFHDMISTYESDEDVLNDVAGNEGVNGQTVLESLKVRSRVKVDIGFNATSPEKRIGRLVMGLGTLFKLFPEMIQTASQPEVTKEVMGALGFDNGERFFPNPDKDPPEVASLRQQLKQAMAMLQGKQMQYASNERIAAVRAISAERVATISGQVQFDIAQLAHDINLNKGYLESVDRQLASQDQDLRQEELQLERAALAHAINQDTATLGLKIHEAIHGKPAPGGGAGGKSKPAPVTVSSAAGGDKAGTLARDAYGALPFAAG